MALQMLETSYSGTYAPYFIMQATFSMDTVQKGVVYVKGDIHKQHTIDRIDIVDPLSPRMATPVDSGENPFIVDGRTITPLDLETYKEFNPRDFEANFLTEQMSATLIARELPPTVEGYMTMILMDRCGEQVELGLWSGSLAYAGQVPITDARYQLQFFDGFINLFVNDALVNKISNPVAITSSNVFSVLDALIADAISVKQALITDKDAYQDMKFLVGPTTYNLISIEQTEGTTFKGANLDAYGVMRHRGWEIVRLAGMPANTVVFCRATDGPEKSNLWVGMNSQQDWQLKLARVQNNSELFFLLGKWKYAVQYGWSQEIFIYTTLTAANFIP